LLRPIHEEAIGWAYEAGGDSRVLGEDRMDGIKPGELFFASKTER
jgi:hypothetical protein